MTAARTLLEWYRREARDLPWRRTNDPYAIWVSEIMLQQTRVETVVPYFQSFLRRFPTVERLAAASDQEIQASWAGLGYYRRARQLQAAAKQVAAAGGRLPRTVEGWRSLPGVGAYTAAAVASIAFGVAAVALDTNVERVMARRLGIAEGARSRSSRQRLLEAAEALLVPGAVGAGNQALMELGARICTPRNPSCPACPLGDSCLARQTGTPERYPEPRRRRAPERQRRIAAAVAWDQRWLLVRRPDDAPVLPGTWELPWVEAAAGRAAAASSFAEHYGGQWRLGAPLGGIRHSITYRQIEIEVVAAGLESSDAIAEGIEAGWFTLDELERLPRSSLLGKQMALLAGAANATKTAGGRTHAREANRAQ